MKHEFTIYADLKTHLRFKVHVWKSYQVLQRVYRQKKRLSTDKTVRACDGFTLCFNTRDIKSQFIGEIHFAQKHLEVETIAHECTHAGMHYVMWTRPADKGHTHTSASLSITNDDIQEAICWSAGLMTEGCIWHLRKLKLKIKPL